nr:LysR substrate-binding domain-containing protein [uncultured Desulfobulbus sp.]
METKQLRYFRAVAEELHFGRAAKKLNISQPPLSQQIKKFEDELGIDLFTRNKRFVSLTPAGKHLLLEAKEILAKIDRAYESLRAVATGEEGHLALGYIGPALDTPLADRIRAFKQRYPKVQLGLVEMPTNAQLQAVLSGEIDAGVVRLFRHDTTGLGCVKFHQESYALAVPKGHPLAPKRAVQIKDLAQEEFIFFPRSSQPHLYDEWMRIFALHGFSPKIVQEAVTKSAALSLAAASIGIAIVPESIQKRAPEQIVFKQLIGECPSLEIHIVFKENMPSTSRDNFLQILKEQIGR